MLSCRSLFLSTGTGWNCARFEKGDVNLTIITSLCPTCVFKDLNLVNVSFLEEVYILKSTM